jgi:outer membrane protein TolC
MRFKVFFALIICFTLAPAQDIPGGFFDPRFPSTAYFRRHFTMPPLRVDLESPTRLRDFVADGKLELSLRSYIELVMANNTDINIQRLSIEVPRDAITRAYGPFDPTLSASFTSTRSTTPPTSALVGASVLTALSQPLRFTFSQTLDTGTSISATFGGEKDSTNDTFATFNPALQSSLSFSFSQPLLRNRGRSVMRLAILVAKGNFRIAENSMRNGMLNLVTAAENAYWDVVQARENLKVQEQSLKMSDASLKLYQRELELGALSPLDIYLPQSQYAAAETAVIQAKYSLAQVEDALRKMIAADLDPQTRNLPIVLTEAVLPPTETRAVDGEAAVQRALALRPDLKAAIGTVEVDDLQIKQVGNALRPSLSLTGTYTSAGRGGIQRTNVFDTNGNASILSVPGGLSDALSQIFHFGFPTYAMGLSLSLPIHDHTNAANLADDLVQKKIDSLAQRTLEQTIRLQVLQAVSQLESSKASIKSATAARDFATKALEAEQKKYELGTNTLFFVLDAETRLVTAESALLTQLIGYRRNELNLLRMTGELLDARGIAIK